VIVTLAVDLVDHRGERRRLPGAGRARHENEPLRAVGELLDDLRQAQLVERADLVGDDADRAPDGAALPVDVAAEPREALDAKGTVALVPFLAVLLLARVEDHLRQP